MTSSNSRDSEFPIDTFFLDRWSPRAFTEETMDRNTMLTILDAAHWAPSSGNNQPSTSSLIFSRQVTSDGPKTQRPC
jgi:hypothetical protein